MRGTKRSYINVNPQLSSVITSLGGITDSIDLMKDGWWKCGAKNGGGADNAEDNMNEISDRRGDEKVDVQRKSP